MERETLIINLVILLELLAPCDREGVRGPKADRGDIEVYMLAGAEFPRAGEFLQIS